MAKINLPPITTGAYSNVSLNNRFQQIEDALNDGVLWRDNPAGEPNAMSNPLDMADNKILNLSDAEFDHEAVNLGQVEQIVRDEVDELIGGLQRTVRTPEDIPALPSAAQRANRLLEFDNDGNPTVAEAGGPNTYPASGITVIPIPTLSSATVQGALAEIAETRVQSVATIADLQSVPSASDGQTFLVQSGTNTGEFTYNASGSGAATFINIVPDILPGRFEKLDNSSAQVVLGSTPQRLDYALGALDSALGALDSRADALESGRATVALTNVTEPAAANLFDSTELVVSTPSGFYWSPDFAIYRDRSGIFRTSVDPKNFIPRKPTTVLYVSKNNGNNANAGTSWDTAFQTLEGALASAAYTGTSGSCIIYVAAGLYLSGEGTGNNMITRDTAIIGVGGVARITAASLGGSVAWTQQTAPNDNVYRTTSSTSAVNAWDSGALTDAGDLARYSKVDSLAECQALAGSYWADGGFLYVHCLDGAMPDDNIYLGRGTAVSTNHLQPTQLYCENISFELGSAFNLRGGVGSKPVVFNRCSFKYMNASGLDTQSREGRVYLFGCRAALNAEDGFDYEQTGGTYQLVLEEGCIGELNGWNPIGSNNGSTAHGGNCIVIRVNGWYDRNADRNVHDVLDSQSWNIGCYSGRPTNGSSVAWENFNFGSGINGTPSDTKVWLDSCITQAGVVDLYAGPGSIIYTRRMSAKTSAGVGDIVPY